MPIYYCIMSMHACIKCMDHRLEDSGIYTIQCMYIYTCILYDACMHGMLMQNTHDCIYFIMLNSNTKLIIKLFFYIYIEEDVPTNSLTETSPQQEALDNIIGEVF